MMKILVAEDDRISRAMLERMLTEFGYNVVSVHNGKQALEKLQEANAPKLAVLDWMMPEMNGVDVCRSLRQMEITSSVYIILLTSRNDRTDIVMGLDEGANDYIIKPYDRNELRARINVGKRVIELQTALMEQQKFQGVIEMAGAVCHEMNQPMQAALGYLQLLLKDISQNNSMFDNISKIITQIERMGKITRKLMGITKYETKDYINTQIIDIDKAAN